MAQLESLSTMLVRFRHDRAASPLQNRCHLYRYIQSCKSWNEYCQILNAVGKNDRLLLAMVIIDGREDLRTEALRQLEKTFYYRNVLDEIRKVQDSRDEYNPDSLFRTIWTPDGPSQCCRCEKVFEGAPEIIWKSCLKHALCIACFTRSASKGENPLHGTCPCLDHLLEQYKIVPEYWTPRKPEVGWTLRDQVFKCSNEHIFEVSRVHNRWD
ncbi:hypothetical protein F4778DRAFT_729126 [Xylariomycetidae sp. FL2044]|nr:hypothetical protein F4778DRAFT_729126 [Xylariomycetidae sp. FL2044]